MAAGGSAGLEEVEGGVVEEAAGGWGFAFEQAAFGGGEAVDADAALAAGDLPGGAGAVGVGERFEAGRRAGDHVKAAFGAVKDGPLLGIARSGGGGLRGGIEQAPGVVEQEGHAGRIGARGEGVSG